MLRPPPLSASQGAGEASNLQLGSGQPGRGGWRMAAPPGLTRLLHMSEDGPDPSRGWNLAVTRADEDVDLLQPGRNPMSVRRWLRLEME